MSHLTQSTSALSVQRIVGPLLVVAIAVAVVVVALAVGGGSTAPLATSEPTKLTDESRAAAVGPRLDQTRPDESRVAEAIGRASSEPYVLRFKGPHPR